MSNQIKTLMSVGVGADLNKYMSTLESLNNIASCIAQSQSDSNLFRVMASFEDAGVINTHDVPVGNAKIKMNYLLSEAIAQTSQLLAKNVECALGAAQSWSSNLNFENQQERLNVAMDRLKEPAKNEPIPEYSQLTEDQRLRVQEIFKTVLKSEETHELNFISEAISRYNAGASRAILFKNLDLKLETSNAVAIYEQDAYNALMNQGTFNYLLNKWESFGRLQLSLKDTRRLTPASLAQLIKQSGFNSGERQGELIKDALGKTNFIKPTAEYNQNEKNQNTYHDLKQVMDDPLFIKPLDTDSWQRLKAIVGVIKNLKKLDILKVDQSETDLDNDEIYSVLSQYFLILDEMTILLTTYLFITQTTARNMSIVEDMITAVNLLTTVLDDLFTRTNECIVEDGNVSQESISVFINKILGRTPKEEDFKDDPRVAGYNGVVNLANRHLETTDKLFNLRLRDNHAINEDKLKAFKLKYGVLIKNLFSKDISNFEIEPLFRFMTNEVFTARLNKTYVHAMSAELYDERSALARRMYEAFTQPEYLEDLYHGDLSDKIHSYYDCTLLAYEDFDRLIKGCDPTNNPQDNKQIILGVIEDRLTLEDTSYYGYRLKLNKFFDDLKLPTVPLSLVNCPSLRSKKYWGYGNFNTTSITKIYSLMSGQPSTVVNLNSIKDNLYLMTYCKYQSTYQRILESLEVYRADGEVGLPKLQSIHKAIGTMGQDIKQHISKNVAFSKDEIRDYHGIIDAWVKDVDDAMISINNRLDLIAMLNTSVTESLNKLQQLYNEFDEAANAFIEMAR